MTTAVGTRPWAGTSGVVSRGVLTGAAIGMTIGGTAGTAAWPVVGTFFGAAAGAMAGLITGVFVGVMLSVTIRCRPRPITQRIVGAAAAGAVIAVAHLLAQWTETLSTVLMAAVLIVLTGFASPTIVSGLPAARFRGRRLPDALTRTLVFGAGIGAVVGALVGIVIGRHYLPLAPAAAIEGAVLGSVSGCVLALLVCAGVVVKSSMGRTRELG